MLPCHATELKSDKFEVNYILFKFDSENLILQVDLNNPHSTQRISDKAQVKRVNIGCHSNRQSWSS